MKIESIKIAEMQKVQAPPQYNKDGPQVGEVHQPRTPEPLKPQIIEAERQASPEEGKAVQQKISPQELEKVVQDANKSLEQFKNKQIRFFVDKRTGKQGVRVVDAKTKKVIKQIPPEEMLELAARIREQIGALVDRTI